MKIAPRLRVPMAVFRPLFKTWKRRCGAQWDNLRPQSTRVWYVTRVGLTCQRVVRLVCRTPPNNHMQAQHGDCACGGRFPGTEATQCKQQAEQATTGGSSVLPVGEKGLGGS